MALVLGLIGLYGVMAYSVGQRIRGIGVRIGLVSSGAEKAQVLRLVATQGMKLVTLGVAVGLTLAMLFSRLLAGLLYGIRPIDPLSFAFAALFLIATAFLACLLPAWRAAKMDPMEALRSE